MSESIAELSDELRKRAARGRVLAFEKFRKSQPENIVNVLLELTAELRSLREALALQAAPGPIEFEVTEREINGDIRAFRVKT